MITWPLLSTKCAPQEDLLTFHVGLFLFACRNRILRFPDFALHWRLAAICWKVENSSGAPHLPGLGIVSSRSFLLVVKVAQGNLPSTIEDAGLPLAVTIMPPHTPKSRRDPAPLSCPRSVYTPWPGTT